MLTHWSYVFLALTYRNDVWFTVVFRYSITLLAPRTHHPPEWLPQVDGPSQLVQRITMDFDVSIAIQSLAGIAQGLVYYALGKLEDFYWKHADQAHGAPFSISIYAKFELITFTHCIAGESGRLCGIPEDRGDRHAQRTIRSWRAYQGTMAGTTARPGENTRGQF